MWAIHVYAPYGSLMIGQEKTDGHIKYAADEKEESNNAQDLKWSVIIISM